MVFIYLEICLEIYFDGKNVKKNYGLLEFVGDHETLSIVRHVGLHVDFSSMKSSLGL